MAVTKTITKAKQEHAVNGQVKHVRPGETEENWPPGEAHYKIYVKNTKSHALKLPFSKVMI